MRVNRAVAVLFALLAIGGNVQARTRVTEAERVEFHSSFWLNLHMTLYADGLAGIPAGPGVRHLVAQPRAPLAGDLTGADRAAWDAAVAYYASHLSRRDLRTGERMTEMQAAIVLSSDALAESPALSSEHRRHLMAAAPVYRARWWPAHDRAIRAWIADVAGKLRETAPKPRERQAALLEADWFTVPVRAEITFYGRAYTTVHPTLTTIAVADPAYDGWAGVEMAFHEVSHALTGPMEARIRRESAALNRKAPDVWHVVMFYITGEVWRSTLAARGIAYEPYMYKNGLFERAWPDLRVPMETYIKPYVDGRTDAGTAYRRLIEAVAER